MPEAQMTRPARVVGVPIAERGLTTALDDLAHRIFAPGSGRSLIRLNEVEIGTGRPDTLLIVVSYAALRARQRAGLRLATLAHARVLESIRTETPSGYCQRHVSQLTKALYDWGWLTKRRRVRTVQSLVERSLLVEAKISNWRQGIVQLTRARWASHQAALLMPRDTYHRVARSALDHNRLGLLIGQKDDVTWSLIAPALRLNWMADLWLTELAIRQVESDES